MRLSRLFLAVAVCLPVSAYAAAPLTDFLAAADAPKLGEPAKVTDVAFTVGHMKIRMADGSAARVMAGNDAIGIYFKGTGSFEYETVEATELPVVEHNVKAAAHVKLTRDAAHGVITDNFGEVLILAGGVALPQLPAAAGAPLADAFAQHNTFFDHLVVVPRAYQLAVQKFAAPASQMVIAEFRGGHDDLKYTFDDVEDHDESLVTVRAVQTYGSDRRLGDRLTTDLLSSQPVGHDRWTTPRPPFVVSAIDYTLTADGDNAKIDVTETVNRSAATQNVLHFDMNKEQYVKPGAPWRQFNVRSITDEQGHSLAFDHSQSGDLVVALEGNAGPVVKLKFAIDGDFLIRQGGDNAWQLYVGDAWIPLSRQLAGSAFTVHSIVKVKKPFIGIAPGTTVARRDEGDYGVVENVIDKPVQFTTVQGGKYTVYEEKRGERTARVFTYGLPNERASKQLSNLALDLIDYYEYFLGAFPFNEFNIIQVNTYGYGQAPPGTMYITNEAFNPMLTEEDQVFSEGINERFAHEIAHQYWAHVVRMPSREEQWLTESFAEYSAALALKKLMPRGDAVYQRLVNHWRANAKQAAAVAPIPYANRIEGDPNMSFAQRTYLLYDKGPYLLYAINKEVGETPFLTFMKSYTKSFNFKFGTTKDVAGLLGVITKKDWKPFFDQYFWGTAMPQ